MSLERPSASSYIISGDRKFLNLVISTISNQISVNDNGDEFMEHNSLVYVKLRDGTIKSLPEYFGKDLKHSSLGSGVQAAQIDMYQKLNNIH